jgi:hypothetical protein
MKRIDKDSVHLSNMCDLDGKIRRENKFEFCAISSILQGNMKTQHFKFNENLTKIRMINWNENGDENRHNVRWTSTLF